MSKNNTLPKPLVVENSGRWLGNDGTWSTFYVHVGTPPQNFHVIPSFKGQTLYVPIEDDCLRMNITDCGGSRGVEIFDQRPSLGFQKNRSSTWEELGIYRLGVGGNLGLVGNGVFGYDTAGPAAGGNVEVPELKRQAVAAYATRDFWLGTLGLSMYALNMTEEERPHSFLSRLKEEGVVPSLSFGYQAGAPYRFTKIAGSLTLGGYDRSRIANETLDVPISEDLFVGLQGITASSSNGTITLLDEGILTVIDTTIPELWLPASVCDAFASTFGLEFHEASDRYALLDSKRTELQDLNPTFSLSLGTSISGGETITIDLPYAAFDLQADYPIFASRTNYFPIRRATNDSQYAIGRVFLQETYLTVDWEHNFFNISKAAFSAPMPEAEIMMIEPKNRTDGSPLIPLSGQGGGSNLSAGAIAGIVIGSVLFASLLGGLAWWFIYRRRKTRKQKEEEAAAVFEEEKKRPEGDEAPEVLDKDRTNLPEDDPGLGDERTGLELEGRPLGRSAAELHAPHGKSEMSSPTREGGTGAVEAEGTSPAHELPSPVYYELPSREHR